MTIKEYLEQEASKIDRSIVATPESREDLEAFATACGGSGTLVMMQMAIQFGYKMALDAVEYKLYKEKV